MRAQSIWSVSTMGSHDGLESLGVIEIDDRLRPARRSPAARRAAFSGTRRTGTMLDPVAFASTVA
jgi:hypothetical protein